LGELKSSVTSTDVPQTAPQLLNCLLLGGIPSVNFW
jgi:hypothetical protein